MLSIVIRNLPILKNYLADRSTLQKVIDNIIWLYFDKILRIGIGSFVTVWITRYLGPDKFGLWNYAIAFTALFSIFANLGLDKIVVRELVKYPEKTGELLGTAFVLRLIGAIVAFVLSIGIAIIIGNRDFLTLSLIALSSGGFIFQAFMVIDYFYQAHIISRYTVWAQNIAFLIMSAVKISLVLTKAPLLAFAIAGLVEIILGSTFLVGLYIFKHNKLPSPTTPLNLEHRALNIKHKAFNLEFPIIMGWRFSFSTAKSLLKDSWPLVLSGIAIMIYMRIDQIMLKLMLGDRAVGIYSAAVRIIEVWYFIPIIIVQSVFPSIINAKKVNEELYIKRLYNLYSLMIWLAIGIAIPFSFLSTDIIRILFGNEYLPYSANVLSIYVWANIPVFLGVASTQYLVVENYTKFSFIRTAIGAISNVVLNLYLIPIYGVIGSAIATFVSYFIATFFIGVIPNKNLKKQAAMMLISIIPWRGKWV